MKREGIRGGIPSNHTIRKHFNVQYSDTKNEGKYKSKFRKQHDYWPFKNKDEWDENMRYNGSNILKFIIPDRRKYDFPIDPEYSKKPFYSIENSDKFDGFSCYLDFHQNRIVYKSKKSMKKQKGEHKKNNKLINEYFS